MAPKRKSDLASPEIEPTPQTKKRGTKFSNADKKRTREEAISGEEVAVVEKTRRKKKEVAVVEESESITPVATVSKVRKSKKSTEVVEIIDTVIANPKQNTTPAAKIKSVKKTPGNRRKSVGIVTLELPSAAKSPIPNTATVSSKVNVVIEESKVIDKLSDETEIVSVWNQCWDALYLCLTTIGPIFLAVILYCYFAGMVKQSQAIASVGVVYTLLFITIMGTYVVAMLPFILISRVFTSLVAPNGSQHSTAQINFYCRLTILIALVSGLIYHFIH